MDENSANELKQIMLELAESNKSLAQTISYNNTIRRASLTEEQNERLKNNDSLESNTETIKQNASAGQQLNRVQQDAIKSAENYNKRMQAFSAALETGTEGLKKVFDKLISQDPSRSFAKYGEGVSQLTDTIGKVLGQFGPLGKAVGTVVSGLGTMYKLQSEQADALHKANDQIAKLGTSGSFTINQLREMANAAGVTSKNMEVLVKPLTSLGPALTNLASNTGDGAKAFAQLTAITNKQREEMQRLGISQEELIQGQADYIKLQSMSGGFTKREAADKKRLQEESLKYVENLQVLAAVSGQDVESVKKKQQEAMNQLNFNIKQAQLLARAKDLEMQGRTEEAAKLRETSKQQREALAKVSAIGSRGLTQAVTEMMATGTATSKGAQAMVRMGMGPAIAEYKRTIERGGNAQEAAAKLQDEYNKKFGKSVQAIGTAAALSQDTADAFDISTETTQQFARDVDRSVKDEMAAREKAVAEAKKSGKDPAQDSRAKLTTMEIEAGKAMDKLLGASNILTGGFTAQTVALTAFGAALTGATALLATKLSGGLVKAGADVLKKARGMPGVPGGGGFAGGAIPSVPPLRPIPGGFAGGAPTPGKFASFGIPGAPGTTSTTTTGGLPSLKPLTSTSIPRAGSSVASPVAAKIPGGVAGSSNLLSSAGKGLGDLGAGAGKFISSVGQGGGKAIQAIFKGVAAGLQAFANPKILLGATIFGSSVGVIITTVGAGIAAASWLMGKALPTLTAGIKEFTTIDGEKLKDAAVGMTALAGGIAAFGAGSAIGGFGNLAGSVAEGITSLFGGKTPFEKLVEFSKLDIDGPKVKSNAEALVAFGDAMAKGGVGAGAGAIGNLVANYADGISKLIGGKTIGEKLKDFGSIDVDANKVKQNAEAMKAFGEAMASFPAGKSALASIGNTVSSLAEGIGSLLGGKSINEKLKDFASMDVDAKKVKQNAEALSAFGQAMQSMPKNDGVFKSMGNVLGSLYQGIGKLVGVKTTGEKLNEFAGMDIKNPEKVKANAEAVSSFGKAMTSLPTDSGFLKSLGGFLGGLYESVGKAVGLKSIGEKLVEFSQVTVDAKKVKNNAEAMKAYGEAMANFPAGANAVNSIAGVVSGIYDGISKLTGAKTIVEKLQEFGSANVDAKKVKNNAEAMKVYGEAMASFPAGANAVNSIAGVVSGIYDGIGKLVGAKTVVEKLQEFGSANVDGKKVKNNAEAMKAYGEAMANFPAGANAVNGIASIAGALVDGVGKLVGAKSTVEKLQEFGSASIDAPKVKNNAEAMKAYGEAMSSFPAGQGTLANIGNVFSSLAETFNKFVGGNSITDKLREFGEAKIDAKKVKDNADGLIAYNKAMGSMSAVPKTAASGLDSSSIKSIGKQLQEFGGLQIDSGKVKSNAEAFTAYNTAMANAKPPAKIPNVETKQVGKEENKTVTPTDSTAAQTPSDDVLTTLSKFNTQLTSTTTALNTFATSVDASFRAMQEVNEQRQRFKPAAARQPGAPSPAPAPIPSPSMAPPPKPAAVPTPSQGTVTTGTGGTVTDSSGKPVTAGALLPAPSAPAPSAPPAQPTPPGAPSAALGKQDVRDNLSGIKAALMKKGFTDDNYLNAILGNVMKESGGKVVNENLNYGKTSNDRIRQIFGKRASAYSDAQLSDIKKDPEKMAEMMYGSSTDVGRIMGNKDPGDGWKYRGRGYIQLTGKNNYATASMAIFNDDRLVKNPDLVNDPKYAAEVVAWYMEKTKGAMQKKMGLGSGPLSAGDAAKLATSQIAGKLIDRGKGFLGTEALGKVEKYASQMSGVQAKDQSFGSTVTASEQSASPTIASASKSPPSGLPGSHKDEGSQQPTQQAGSTTQSPTVALAGQEKITPKEQVQKAGLQVRPYGDVFDGGLMTNTALNVAKSLQDTIPEFNMFTGLNDAYHKAKHPRSAHAFGRGMDLVLKKMPSIEESQAIKASLQKIPGVSLVANEYYSKPHGDRNEHTTGPHFHVQTSAAKGAIIDGPKGGYPVDLTAHGREVIAPLSAGSVLEKMSTTPANSQATSFENSNMIVNNMDSGIKDLLRMSESYNGMLLSKLDQMINKLEQSNDTQGKILQYTRV